MEECKQCGVMLVDNEWFVRKDGHLVCRSCMEGLRRRSWVVLRPVKSRRRIWHGSA